MPADRTYPRRTGSISATPATDSGGVDVPHAVAAQRVAGCLSVMRELVETVEADDIHQPLRGDVRYLDGLHGEDCRFNGGSESPT